MKIITLLGNSKKTFSEQTVSVPHAGLGSVHPHAPNFVHVHVHVRAQTHW